MNYPAAIRDNPDDDALRAKYADWLEQNGQQQRAEWMRASFSLASMSAVDPEREAVRERARLAFKACRPTWWEDITNVSAHNDRGMFCFEIGTTRGSRGTALLKRLAKAAWLAQAYEEGWLQRIDIKWCDNDFVDAIAQWRGPTAHLPLLVAPAPQIGEEGLQKLLSSPRLVALELETPVSRNPALSALAQCNSLRSLTLEVRVVDDATVDTRFEQVLAIPRLVHLHLKGHKLVTHGQRPNDADLRRFEAMPSLKHMHLTDAPAVSEEALLRARKTWPVVTLNHMRLSPI